MTNWRPESAEQYEDVQTRNQALNLKGEKRLKKLWRCSRDSARTPVQWSAEENAGFSTGKPWFFVNENYPQVNVAAQENDPDSLLNFYRKAIRLRKSLSVVQDGSYREFYRHSGKLYVYTRETARERLLVVCSFTEKPVRFRAPKGCRLDAMELLLENYGGALSGNGFVTKPYETRVYLEKI